MAKAERDAAPALREWADAIEKIPAEWKAFAESEQGKLAFEKERRAEQFLRKLLESRGRDAWDPSDLQDLAEIAERVLGIDPGPLTASEIEREVRKALRAEPPLAPGKVEASARPLSPVEEAIVQILESLPPGKAIDAKCIMRKLRDQKISIGQTVLARHIAKLKSRFGIVNTRGIGYHIAR